jgi:spore cortex biosynthesis protein YabQ
MPNQIKLFLLSLTVGIFSGVLYSLIKILRKLIKHNNTYVQIEDLLYWLIVSSGMFFIMLNENYGEIRCFCTAAVLIGVNIYSLLLDKPITICLLLIIQFILNLFIGIINLILYPIKLLLKPLKLPLRYLISLSKRIIKVIKLHVRTSKQLARTKARQNIKNIKAFFNKI